MMVLNIYEPNNTLKGTVLPGVSPAFKSDGSEFKEQSEYCMEYYSDVHDAEVETVSLPVLKWYATNKAMKKRQHLFHELDMLSAFGKRFDRINFFMHGHPKALNRNMISTLNIDSFCERLKLVSNDGCKIALYACQTAKLDNGFACQVAVKTGLDVLGHTTSGHTTKNPHKRTFKHPGGVVGSIKQWPWYGGASALRKRLEFDNYAPFEFVEEVFGR